MTMTPATLPAAPAPADELPAADALRELAAMALAAAAQQGASAAEVSVAASRALTVNLRCGEIESVEFQRDHDLSISVYFGQCRGSANSTDLKPAAVRETAAQACAIARYTGADPYAGLAPAALMARQFPALDLDHPWPLVVADAVALARAAEDAAFAADARISNSEGASLDTRRGLNVYANSHGFSGEHCGTQHSLSCAVIAGRGDEMQRDYWYTAARLPSALEPAAAVGRRAAERAIRRLQPRRVPTGRSRVLFAPELARGLFGSFVSAISGGNLYRKTSFLLDQVGQPVFAPHIQIRQRPHLPRAMGSCAFDRDGVATRERQLVSDGVLQGYVLSAYSARRLGLETTGNAGGVFNLEVEPGRHSFAEMVAQMGSGLIVTELMGQGVNMVTGDYSRGAAGLWVENGAIAYPVQEITIAGNLREMFRQMTLVGSELDRRGNIACAAVLVEGMTVAGQ